MTEPINVQAAPVLETKLRRPSMSPLLVTRPRLLGQLSTWLDRKLILVSAPAGYGKTALVSEWLSSFDGGHAWFSLDGQDDDLPTFLLYLLTSIQTAYPQAMAASLLLLKAPTLAPPNRLADVFLQDLAALPGPMILALDDYHSIKAAAIHEFMARFVEHLPAQVHLVLITRADPPLPLGRLRAGEQLGETRAADLRFTPGETRLLLQRVLGPDVSEETAGLLEDSTEGWAIGLHLAALSLRNRSDAAAFARKIAEHGHQVVTEYLLSEVLERLPEARRDLLVQTSLFDRFCAPLVNYALTNDEVTLSADEFVRTIQRTNLFVVSLDDAGTWFRYHHFFQALLRARLSQRHTVSEIKGMHARASAWFASRGLVDEAVSHALEAGDPDAAASLVEAQVHPALDRENWHRFEHWIRMLPVEMGNRPRLLTAQAWLHVLRYQFGMAAQLLDTAEGIAVADPETVLGSEGIFWGEINVLRAMVAYYDGDFRRTAQLTEVALGQLGPDTLYATGQASLYHIWGLQASGEHERAIAFAYGQLEAYGLHANALTLRVLLVLVNIHYEIADLPRMRDTVAIFEDLARRSGLEASLAWVHYMHGWLHYQRNELVAAGRSFQMLADVSASAHAKAIVDGFAGLALTALAQGRPDEARVAVAALRQRLIERELLALMCVADSLEQRIALAVDPGPALEWRPPPASSAVPVDFWEQPALTHVRTLLAAGSPRELAEAAELLAEIRAKALARSLKRGVIVVGGLQALVLSAQGNHAAALAALREAVEGAAPGGALRLLADCGPGLAGLLRELEAAGGPQGYIQKLLAVLDETATEWEVAESSSPGSAPGPDPHDALMTNRQIDILILLAERLSDKEIAQRLVLSPVTVKKHTQRIYRKLGVDNRGAAVARARQLGLI